MSGDRIKLKPCPFCGESKLLYSGGCGFRYDDDDNQIRLFRVHCRTCKGRTGLFESLDEAIEAWNRRTNSTTIQPSALGTNLAEVGTDCISRQQAIDVVMECYDNDELFEVYEWKLNELPAIQPKRGQWIDDGSELGCQCSQCGKTLDEYINCGTEYMTLTEIPKFCPNCGADMRKTT